MLIYKSSLCFIYFYSNKISDLYNFISFCSVIFKRLDDLKIT
ncbi:hypothetical protein THOB06_160064 [Vibrio rotiferianus]|nr:hypothetical protein THOG10_160064 [Vibrio rotiferianus]CAH1567813.1 hypothetical protein THOB06_160064 [Vibrio rotiferianus]